MARSTFDASTKLFGATVEIAHVNNCECSVLAMFLNVN